jgi:hypothetical protein
MNRLATLFCTVTAVLALAATSRAQPTILIADIRNDAENPPAVPTTSTGDPRPASFGTAMFTLNEAMTELSFTAEIFNIDVTGSQTPDTNDDLTNAHIHAGELVTPTTNGGVVWGFHGSPFNNNSPNDAVFTPFTTGVGGTFSGTWNMSEGNNTTLTDQLANILGGRSYINFHTVDFAGGEIRGNITVIPEPATGVIAACCAGLALFAVRRRKSA